MRHAVELSLRTVRPVSDQGTRLKGSSAYYGDVPTEA